MLLAMIRVQITIVSISPRNSAPAVAHLLSKTNPSHVLVSSDKPMQSVVANAIELLKQDHPETAVPESVVIPTFEEMYSMEEPFVPLPAYKHDWDRPLCGFVALFFHHDAGEGWSTCVLLSGIWVELCCEVCPSASRLSLPNVIRE